MKIAISATEKGTDGQVDIRFGRCPYFIIAEIENKKLKSQKKISNTAATQGGGAGISAAQIVGNEKVEAVISTNLGPRALQVLQELEIEIYQGSGEIKDVIQQFIDGKLEKISSATGPEFMGKK